MKKFLMTFSYLLLLPALSILMEAGNHNTYPLPEDRGTAGAIAALEKLPIFARVLQITAHPDDESAGTLTWLARNIHAQTALFSLTRGEGGQNVLGDEKYEALGLVRAGELQEACKYYGAELYFGKVIDFGFSKTADETLAKWNHNLTLGDMVQFIRWWRPTIILSRFSGNPSDGHGHHQAAGLLAREAFRAAADPNKYPEQFATGLHPWQATKLFISQLGNTGQSGKMIRIPIGDYDPVLGRSYREIAAEGYSKHRTQGSGANYLLPGEAFEYFNLADSTLENGNQSFFDSMDISLKSILDLAGNERSALSSAESDLASADTAAREALRKFRASTPQLSADDVAQGIRALENAIDKTKKSSVSGAGKDLVLDALQTKLADFQQALNAVLGIDFLLLSDKSAGTPGEAQSMTVHFYNRGQAPVVLKNLEFTAPKISIKNGTIDSKELAPGQTLTKKLEFIIKPEATATEPYWKMEDATGTRYVTKGDGVEFAPFSQPEISATASFEFRGIESKAIAIAKAQTGDAIGGSNFVEFQIIPDISVSLEPDLLIVANSNGVQSKKFRVSVTNNIEQELQGIVKLKSNAGWIIKPESLEFSIARKDEKFIAEFESEIPAQTVSGEFLINAVAIVKGKEYTRGFQTLSYPENWTKSYFVPAQAKIKEFSVKIAPNLKVGYIPGAGDDVPKALEQLGIKVKFLTESDLAFEDLSQWDAIVAGIRSYNVNKELRTHNQRVLEYVKKGGTLIIQYVRPEGGGGFKYSPYSMTVSDSSRITVEDSPIKMLDPQHPIFNVPNKITDADFDGWVQERGLYFMTTWDPQYKALLSGNDPGEGPQNGGLLIAPYGKGKYIYTGYSWFRQLPAGVPGAFRIFANILSLSQSPKYSR